jgi:predicted nucleic acid-binding protein
VAHKRLVQLVSGFPVQAEAINVRKGLVKATVVIVRVPEPLSTLKDCSLVQNLHVVPISVRSGDALHLACAEEHGFREVYTNDRHILEAAKHFNISGVNGLSQTS